MQFISCSEKQTFDFAKKFAKQATGGQIIGLIGNLGAGKTIFAKGFARGLGIKKNITSPTFVLMKIYPAKSARVKFFAHIDAYRVKSARDLSAIGADEYFNAPDAVAIIEWADKIKKILPQKTKIIKIKISGGKRIIYF